MQKLFLYSNDIPIDNAARNIIEARGFTPVVLGNNHDDTMAIIQRIVNGGVLALLSHGDNTGPLFVSGQRGDTMSEEAIRTFGVNLREKNITFFCLSCHTGAEGMFLTAMRSSNAKFIAPIGFAEFTAAGDFLNLHSKENGNGAGWSTGIGEVAMKVPRMGSSLYFN